MSSQKKKKTYAITAFFKPTGQKPRFGKKSGGVKRPAPAGNQPTQPAAKKLKFGKKPTPSPQSQGEEKSASPTATSTTKKPRFGKPANPKPETNEPSSFSAQLQQFGAQEVVVEKQTMMLDEDSDDEPVIKRKKRKRTFDDSDDEYAPPADAGEQEDDLEDEKDNLLPPKKKKKPSPPPGATGDVHVSGSLSAFAHGESTDAAADTAAAAKKFKKSGILSSAMQAGKVNDGDEKRHKNDVRHLDWYLNRRDKQKRFKLVEGKPNPDFNLREWWHPAGALKNMTNTHKMWWQVKSDNADAILFFKVGKFYEIFNDDADICHQVLDLKYMGHGVPHVGVPETSFDQYATSLIEKGYKIIRIEQMVDAKTVKSGKMVPRDICQVLTPGTSLNGNAGSRYILAVTETLSSEGVPSYGIALLEPTTAHLQIGFFEDLATRTKFRTILTQFAPKEVIWLKNTIQAQTDSALKADLQGDDLRLVALDPKDWWSVEKARAHMKKADYWKDLEAPKLLEHTMTKDTPDAVAFSGLLAYITHTMIDKQVVPQLRVTPYGEQADTAAGRVAMAQAGALRTMQLDGQTLTNLDILRNAEGKPAGSILSFINHTVTSMGNKKIEQWLMRPLSDSDAINARLEAIENFLQCNELATDIKTHLKKLPNMDRLLSQIFSNSTHCKMDEANMFSTYLANAKIEQFTKLLDALTNCGELFRMIGDYQKSIYSKRLQHLTTAGKGFPEFEDVVEEFGGRFDPEIARKGSLKPKAGAYPEFDKIAQGFEELDQDEQSFLEQMKTELGCNTLCYNYNSSSKNRLLIKAPAKLEVPSHWRQEKATTKYRQFFVDPEFTDFNKRFDKLKEREDAFLDNFSKRLYREFSSHRPTWTAITNCVAELDCLQSLYCASHFSPHQMCRPTFLAEDQEPYLCVKEGKHPTAVSSSFTGGGHSDLIANDTHMGTEENPARFILLTGPNMGGKSTFLRQICVLVILAQIGCFVPAASMTLTPVDKIFTRIGANDNILSGQSTFMVELDETSTILRGATKRSLVVLDELGRGTSTFDGASIAFAVAKHLVDEIKCRGIFASHYHILGQTFAKDPRIGTYFMNFLISGDDVTFLYKAKKGVCSHSHGINCAKIAGLQPEIVDRAKEIATKFEQKMEAQHPGGGEASDVDPVFMAKFKNLLRAIKGGNKELCQKLWAA